MYKLVIKVHKLFFCSHVIKVHLRTSGVRGGGGQGIWQSQPTLMCTWSETLNCFNRAADKNKGCKKQRTVYSSKKGNNTSVKKNIRQNTDYQLSQLRGVACTLRMRTAISSTVVAMDSCFALTRTYRHGIAVRLPCSRVCFLPEFGGVRKYYPS